MGGKIRLDVEEEKLLKSKDFIGNEVLVNRKPYYPKEVKGSGSKGVVWKGIDQYDAPVVIKFTIERDYINRAFLQEATRAAKLRKYSQFAHFYDAGLVKLKTEDGKEVKYICFIEEYIDGKTFEEYIKNNEITASFIINYIKGMCRGLNILKELSLRHDDLKPANVMIASPKTEALSDEFTVKIVDMGSLKPYDQELTKEKDDLGWFIEHLLMLFNCMLFLNNQRKPLSLTERIFRKAAIPLLNSILEEDKQIALIEPQKIITAFDNVYMGARYPHKEIKLKLENPFDYISAEHIASDELLVKLFAESCPWVKEVTSPNPILLTGPRGCGKSMLFRRLSLKALLYKRPEELKASRIAGFYISCSASFRNRFGWITSESLAKKFDKEIVHYFNLLLTYEVIQTLLFISKREDSETLFGLGDEQEKEIHTFLIEKLNIKDERRLHLQGVKPLEHLLEIIEFEMNICYNKFLKRLNLDSTTPISFLSDLSKLLKKKIRFLNGRMITFLLDDYSIHRISEKVQYILNPIIWDRQASHIFKLSTEKYGAERIFDYEKESSSTADITREYREIDCGQVYIYLSDSKAKQDLINFAKELLDHRLSLAEYAGTSDKLIGYSGYKSGGLVKALKSEPKLKDHYSGLDVIAEICSGDISALLEIYRRIFREGNVTKDTIAQVKPHIQHKSIKNTSSSFLNLIKTYHPFGEEMYNIVINFGTLCRKILCETGEMSYKIRGGGVKLVPKETTRIEVDQIPDKEETWSADQQLLMKELVRRSIFIELELGRGRHSLGPTWRWQLRRLYCPIFGTGLKKNTAIKWSVSDLKYFLTDPKEKCDSEFNKWKNGKESMKDLSYTKSILDFENELK